MARSYGNFDLLQRVELDFADVVVEKWRSRTTGLSVVHIDYESPIVNGHFVVRSEIFNDSGCPHTLEHLIFMGSQRYPYKGIIDRFANRGFANGTGAWTSVDNTVYTIETAGDQGFLQLLPIYIDHLLFPTLTESAFVTEVHHVDKAGQDAGIVYCEMQGRENTSGDLMQLALKRLIFPEGSGYRSETAGLMSALRDLNIKQIRDYHAEYYVPHNLCLIVSGKIGGGTDSLLSVIQREVEPTLIENSYDKGHHPPGWLRPFVETPSADRKRFTSQTTVVQFPDRDESTGTIWMTLAGPATVDYLTQKALNMLSEYLSSSPVAPLNKEFVEIESPLCTGLGFWSDACATFHNLNMYAASVPTEHLESFNERVRTCLEKIASEGFDMKRMHMVIKQNWRQWRSYLENSKGEAFYSTVIEDFLLGSEDGSELRKTLDTYRFHDELYTWSNGDWVALLKKYYFHNPSITAIGRPSVELADRLEKEEKERIAAQVQALGPEGLAKKEDELGNAKAENEKPVPEHILTSFPVPDVKSITWITVRSVQDGLITKGDSELVRHIDADGSKLPFFVQFDHVQSEFVEITAWLSLAGLPDYLRPLMSVYQYVFFSLPLVTSSGEKLGFEEVVSRLEEELVHYTCDLGFDTSSYSENFFVGIKVEKEKYDEAIRWMKDLIYGTEFDLTRLQTNCAQIVQGLSAHKRDAQSAVRSYRAELLLDKSSIIRATTVLEQARAIPELLRELEEKPESVRRKFEEIRQHMTNPSGVRFSVIGDISRLAFPRRTWAKYFSDKLPGIPLQPVRFSLETLSDLGRNPTKKALVVSVPSIENFSASFVATGIQGFDHPEYPALYVALQALNALEGFLHVFVRGMGLSYGVWIIANQEEGTLRFVLERSTNCIEAFKQGAKAIEGLINGTVAFDDTVLDAAKSSVVYETVNGVSDPRSAAFKSFANQALKGLSQNHHRELLVKCQAVSKAEVLAAIKKYCQPLFDSSKSVAVVASPHGKVGSTMEELRKLGYEAERRDVELSAEPQKEDGS